jgi:hypothetical protein
MISRTTNALPRISIQELENLSFESVKFKIIIHQVSGYFMPFVYQIVDNETKLLGIIVSGDHVVATVELADTITAVKELIGNDHLIITPDTPGYPTKH